MKLFEIQIENLENKIRLIFVIFGIKIKLKIKVLGIRKDVIDRTELIESFNRICDIRLCPKAKGKLRKLQIADTLLLKWFHNICQKHNIQYFLKDGTLLGAIRHNGFIPWDDDLDVHITLDSFDKVIEVLEEEIKKTKFELFGIDKTRFGNATIRVTHKDFPYLNLDIFYVHPSKLKYEDREFIYKNWSELRKEYYEVYPKLVKYETREQITQFRKDIDGRFNTIIDFCNIDEANIVINQISSGFHVYKTDWIYPLKLHKFEDYEFYIPNNYKKVLDDIYGDYMSFPPKFGHESLFMDFNEETIDPIIKELEEIINVQNAE